jgi:polyphenol oxidase
MMHWIEPDWPAPKSVHAASTLRTGGASSGIYGSLNLGHHVGDDDEDVRENRRVLRESLSLPAEPVWLQQVHGTRVVDVFRDSDRTADAAFTDRPDVVCAVLTADCLPILLCSTDGTRIAAVHGGWRGLAAGVLASAIDRMGTRDLLAWFGPAIGPQAFEVGAEVRDIFLQQNADLALAFRPADSGRWFADLYAIARALLAAQGVTQCYGGGLCTHSDSERFFSFRRDGVTGRMATLIWRDA